MIAQQCLRKKWHWIKIYAIIRLVYDMARLVYHGLLLTVADCTWPTYLKHCQILQLAVSTTLFFAHSNRGICYRPVSVGVLSKRLNTLSWFLAQSLYHPIILHCVIRKCEWYLHKSVNSTDCPAKHNSSDWTGKTSVSEQQWYFGDGRGSLRAKKGRKNFWGWSCGKRGIVLLG